MFFIGIFGIENKDKEIKNLNNIGCRICNKTISGRLVKNFDFFHFFFIPLFKWSEKYYVVCNECKSVYIIPSDKGKAIERGEKIEVTYWDLQEIKTQYYDENYYNGNKCANCRGKLDGNFKYCPHCGVKI